MSNFTKAFEKRVQFEVLKISDDWQLENRFKDDLDEEVIVKLREELANRKPKFDPSKLRRRHTIRMPSFKGKLDDDDEVQVQKGRIFEGDRFIHVKDLNPQKFPDH